MTNPNQHPTQNNSAAEESTPSEPHSFAYGEVSGGIAIAPVTHTQHELLTRPAYEFRPTDACRYALALGVAVLPPVLQLPELIQYAGVATGGTWLSFLLKHSLGEMRHNRKQTKVVAEALVSDEAHFFADRWLDTHVSPAAHDTLVGFNSLEGEKVPQEVRVTTLLKSIGQRSPGILVGEESPEGWTKLQVSPGQLVRTALQLVSKDRQGEFLRAARTPLQTVHEAAATLISPDDMPRASETMNQNLEKTTTKLLLGTLGVYGVLRSEVAPSLGEALGHRYPAKEQGDEAFCADLSRLHYPTRFNVPWADIEAFRDQLNNPA